ncbi:MAG: substrate-binding domain-containing protein, partial [Alphaproteobacteria bacterium]
PTGHMVDHNPVFMEFLSGVAEFAAESGFDIVLSPAAPDAESATYRRLAVNGQVDGIFISSPVGQDKRIELLSSLKLPFVVHGRSEGIADDYPYLDIDNEGAFYSACRLLTQLGHTSIGFLNGLEEMTFAEHRQSGVLRALGEAGLMMEDRFNRRTAMTEEQGYRLTLQLLDGSNRPSALLCSSVILALGAIRAIGDRGLTPGRDISVIAHDDVFPYLKPENFRTPLTTTRSSIRAAGKRIGERLAAQINMGAARAGGEIWPVDLVVRASTGPAPGKS